MFEDENRAKISRRAIVAIPLVIVIIAIFVILTQSVIIVPAGTRGVVLTWGQVTGILGEGLNFVTPIVQKVEIMDVTIQKAETSESTASKDLQEVTTTIAVNYRLNPSFVDQIYRDLRRDYENRVIKPNIEETIKATTAQYKAEELITKRASVKTSFEQDISDRLEVYNIEILQVSITDFQFSEVFSAAIEAKVVAEQRALEAQNKLEQIRYEAQQQVIQAEAAANATIAKATADAEAIALLKTQLDQIYLDYIALQTWDGKLPIYLGGDVLPFLQIPINSTSQD